MNKSVFLNLVLQQQPISEPDTEALEALAKSFPYCQTAHLLLAKAAYDRGSMLSNQKLRRAAAYATNRQLLKKLIYTTTATVTLQPVLAREEEPETPIQPEKEQVLALNIPITETPQPATEENGIVKEEEIAVTEKVAATATELPEKTVTETASTEIPLTAIEATTSELQPSSEVFLPEIAALSESETNVEIPLTGAEASAVEQPVCSDEPAFSEAKPETVKKAESESVDEELARLLVIDHILSDPDLFASGNAEHDSEMQELAETMVSEIEKHEEDSFADFDQYLFKPEREIVATEPEENLQVSYPEDESEKIFVQDPLGYWMNSSRLGECLQLKEDWTTHPKPYDFHPELLLEYNKEHPVTKTLEPSDSILSQQLDIIDQFLKQNPRLKSMGNVKNIRTEPLEDLSLKSTKIKKDMASENLAHIFMQQGKIKKAIKIYEHLILKIPEKKPYFVAQIEKLQNTL